MGVHPPGPNRWHPFGSLLAFRSDPLAFLDGVAAQYGPVSHFRFGRQHSYLVTDPDLVREILVVQNRHFVKSRLLQRARELLGDGLLTNEGESHLRQRRMIQPSFHRDRITSYGQEMVAQARGTSDRWRDGQELDISAEMTRLTLTIAGSTLLGSEVGEGDAATIGHSLTDALGLFERMTNPLGPLLDRLPVASTRRLLRARQDLDAAILRMIAEKRATAAQSTDLLSALLLAQDDEGNGARMTDRQVRDEILTIFLAGHETTANALSWTWLLLSENPEARNRLHQEVDAVLGGRMPDPSDYPRLPYTRKVLAESMRLFPPAWSIGRQPLQDIEIGGFILRAGSIVLMSPWVTHRDSRWFPDPLEFRPDRWTDEMESALPRGAYIPFGSGTRKCIGEGFAWMEGVLVLATIAQNWSIDLVEAAAVRPQPLITLRLANGAPSRVHRR